MKGKGKGASVDGFPVPEIPEEIMASFEPRAEGIEYRRLL